MSKSETSYRWRVAAWESRHGRNFRSPFFHTVTVTGTALLNDPTWKDKL